MSKYVKVRIDMDEHWIFYAVEDDPDSEYHKPTMILPLEFLEEYNRAYSRLEELNAQMEQLWRIQDGRKVYSDVPIPNHQLLPEEKKDGA